MSHSTEYSTEVCSLEESLVPQDYHLSTVPDNKNLQDILNYLSLTERITIPITNTRYEVLSYITSAEYHKYTFGSDDELKDWCHYLENSS